jgi:uncharacterized protein
MIPRVTKVVDSWPVVAWLLSQSAAAAVESYLQRADAGEMNLVMSWVNVGEVFYIVAKRHGVQRANEFLSRLPSLPIRLVLPDEDGILAAARIKAGYALAFGDAFAIALAQAEGVSIITGDAEIRKCAVVPVDWVGV